MAFGDLDDAAKMLAVIERVAQKVVKENAPSFRTGRVFTYDLSSQSVYVLFPGNTVDQLVKVRAARNMMPTVAMDSQYEDLGLDAPGDVVRVTGEPGSYFIVDYVSGVPRNSDVIPIIDVDFGGQRGVNLGEPVDPTDAATKEYVDSIAGQGPIEFSFATASVTWTMPHGLGRRPVSVTMMDFSNQEFWADVTFPDANTAVATFGTPVAGYAIVTR